MAELNTEPAPWLQKNWSPRETFDPTPWLNERYRRQVEQAKLPLQLQGMALQNQAQQLMIEHQGIVNDELNDELKKEAEDQPIFKQASIAATNLPGGTLEMGSQSFASKKYSDLWRQKQLQDAQTSYNVAKHSMIIDQTKDAETIMSELKVEPPQNPDGTYVQPRFAELLGQATETRAKRLEATKLSEIEAQTKWHKELLTDPNYWRNRPNPSSMSPVARRAFEKEQARTRLQDAYASGDPDEIDAAEQYLQDYNTFAAREHIDPHEAAQLAVLKGRIGAIDRMMANPAKSAAFPELKTERDRLQKQLDEWQSSGLITHPTTNSEPLSSKTGPVTGSTNAEPILKRKVFKNGSFINP